MLEEFGSMRDGHPGRINVSKKRINLLDDEVRLVYFAWYRQDLEQGILLRQR